MRLRRRTVALLLVTAISFPTGCGQQALPTSPPNGTAEPAYSSPPPVTASPRPTPRPSLPASPTPYVAPSRTVLDIPEQAQLIVGRLAADGGYEVLALEFFALESPVLLGVIPDFEARLPDDLRLARHRPAAVSDTGFLVVTVERILLDEAGSQLAIFDLASPDAPPWLTAGDRFRLVGDRLWVVSGADRLDVFDLPHRGPKSLTLPPGRSLVRDGVVPFFVTEAGDAALLEAQGDAGPTYSLLRVDAVAPPLGDEAFAWTTAREQPFGRERARILIGIGCGEAAASYCIDRETGPDVVVEVDGLADAAWEPDLEGATIHVGAGGIERARKDGTRQLFVTFDRRPVRIVGFWSNLAIVSFGDDQELGAVYIDVDAITKLPLGPESIKDVPGDVLLRTMSWHGDS